MNPGFHLHLLRERAINEKEYVDTMPSQDTAFSSLASTFRNKEFGAGYRVAAFVAAVFCILGGIVFLFYNERKINQSIN